MLKRLVALALYDRAGYEGVLIARLAHRGGRHMASRKNGRGNSRAKTKKMAAAVAEPIEQPTPEQAGRVEYERRELKDEMGKKIGVSYRRRPLYETMADKGGIAPNELAALRYYRTAFDRCERSPTKSCLNVGAGGSRNAFNDIAHATEAMLDARRRVARCESVLGINLATMRAVVLHDRSFSEIAIERWGGRDQTWIVNGRNRTKIVPRSGRHREVVRQEFLDGMRTLRQRLAAITNMLGVTEIWIEPDDAGATVMLGMAAPSRRYRLWGSYDAVASVRDALVGAFGQDHVFASAELARAALDDVNEKQRRPLLRLEDEELAR